MTVLNGTEKSDGFKLSVYSLLQHNAKYRNHLAFQSEEKEYSWGELFDFICKVAYGLAKKGINRDS
ncbi:hypothetical protein [Lachnoclostridium phytofermentans]|uniref:hypothetical protein n=1 Tax=Lachnoclostridium phytofermentans TaxID=66219 RepID=UPI0005A30142|nr:hypothetical protein [Lachnoclostridium phytofermentans]